MSKVLWHMTASLDGFIAPPDDSTEWMFGHGRPGPLGREAMERTGAIHAGRRGFDLGNQPAGAGEPRAIYGGAWTGPVFVLTHRPAEPVDGLTFLTGDIAQAVDAARRAAGERDLGIFGADIARQCLLAGLVDEIIVHLLPVLLGDGVRMFQSAGTPPISLRQTRSDNPGQITDLAYTVLR